MLKLKELKISGIGRFVEEQTINFDSLGNLVQLDGENRNTGGSSGAGKSTVFNALDYLFGLNDLPNTVLKSRLTDNPMNVEGIFDFDGKILIIKRGKKLSIELDGQLTTGSSKLAEEKLDEILAMPRTLFRVMLHKRQKEGGFFLNFTPSETNSFLTDCLGHGALKPKLQLLVDTALSLKSAKEKAESKLQASKTGLQATLDAISTIAPPVKEIDEATVEGLKHKYDAANGAWLKLQAEHKAEVDALELTRPKIVSVSFDRSILEDAERQLNQSLSNRQKLLNEEKERQTKARLAFGKVQSEITKCQNAIHAGERAEQEAAKLTESIKAVRAGNCETCQRPWHHEAREKTLIASLLATRPIIAAGKQATIDLPLKEAEASSLTADMNPREIPNDEVDLQRQLTDTISDQRAKEKSHQATETEKVRAAQNSFAEAQKTLKEMHSDAALQASGQAQLTKLAYDSAALKLKSYKEALDRHTHSMKNLSLAEAKYLMEVEDATQDLAKFTKNLEMTEELKRAIKSYLSCSFDDALEAIGTATTNLIRNIPNMANATVQLEGMKETKEGKVKEEVNAVIHMDGEEGVPIKSLCGGERSSVDLAIDLSVIDYIESKTNKGIDLFVLDEPFNGLDTVCIEMALEVLKNSNLNKKLVIVDHNPEVKQMVESRLVVIREGSTSKISQS